MSDEQKTAKASSFGEGVTLPEKPNNSNQPKKPNNSNQQKASPKTNKNKKRVNKAKRV